MLIVAEPDQTLHQVSAPVQDVAELESSFFDDLLETMYEHDGLGLSAPQVGKHVRVFVLDKGLCPESVFVNPEIVATTGAIVSIEGCLSLPDQTFAVPRARKVTIVAQNRRGTSFRLDLEGLAAVAVQHEMDHLNGLLINRYGRR